MFDTYLQELATKDDVQSVKEDVQPVKEDVQSVKSDVRVLRDEVRKDIARLDKQMWAIKWMLALILAATVLPALKGLFRL